MNGQRKFFFIDGYLVKASWRSPSGSIEAWESEMHLEDADPGWDAADSPEDDTIFHDSGAVFQIEVEQVVPGTILLRRS